METAFDRWLTNDSRGEFMERITQDRLMDTDKETGITYPTHIDELSCEDCDWEVGWSSNGGFTEFYADDSDTHYKCEDCHQFWENSRYTE
jgi:hypothetical protein